MLRTNTCKVSDCDSCSFRPPDPIPENADTWELWHSAVTQWRASAFSLIGLDYNAVYLIAETVGIQITPSILKKLQFLEHKALEKSREEAKTSGKQSTNYN